MSSRSRAAQPRGRQHHPLDIGHFDRVHDRRGGPFLQRTQRHVDGRPRASRGGPHDFRFCRCSRDAAFTGVALARSRVNTSDGPPSSGIQTPSLRLPVFHPFGCSPGAPPVNLSHAGPGAAVDERRASLASRCTSSKGGISASHSSKIEVPPARPTRRAPDPKPVRSPARCACRRCACRCACARRRASARRDRKGSLEVVAAIEAVVERADVNVVHVEENPAVGLLRERGEEIPLLHPRVRQTRGTWRDFRGARCAQNSCTCRTRAAVWRSASSV